MSKRTLTAPDDDDVEASDDKRQHTELALPDLWPTLEKTLRDQLESLGYAGAPVAANSAISLVHLSVAGSNSRAICFEVEHNWQTDAGLFLTNSTTTGSFFLDTRWKRRVDVCNKTYPNAFVFTAIQSLSLMGLAESRLPDGVGALRNLTFLYVSDFDHPIELTETIAELPSLEELIFSNCIISNLAICSKMTTLTNVSFTDMSIDAPAFLGCLTNLTSLSMESCSLRDIPAEWAALRMLRALSLSNNPLRELPWQMCGAWTQLTSLCLDNTLLVTLPPEIGRLLSCQLRHLDVCMNTFRNLPCQINCHKTNFLRCCRIIVPPEYDYIGDSTRMAPVITHWDECTYMAALPRELQLILYYLVDPPYEKKDP